MRTVCCRGCRGWFHAKLSRCPLCGMLRPSSNVALLSERARNVLWDRARRAVAEDTFTTD